ncbi:MAG: ATP-binding protein [Actinomycetota bacterium]|nr:ATP-binding protein [Actinomycetota bacterium]
MPTPTSRPRPAVLDLEQHPAAVRRARRFVQDQCHAAGINGETSETAVLLTSEIVTNAFLHGQSGAWVTLTASEDSLRVEVGDGSARQPRLVHTDREALHGRGLAIVDTLAAAWGATGHRRGKVVWFELTRRRPTPR